MACEGWELQKSNALRIRDHLHSASRVPTKRNGRVFVASGQIFASGRAKKRGIKDTESEEWHWKGILPTGESKISELHSKSFQWPSFKIHFYCHSSKLVLHFFATLPQCQVSSLPPAMLIWQVTDCLQKIGVIRMASLPLLLLALDPNTSCASIFCWSRVPEPDPALHDLQASKSSAWKWKPEKVLWVTIEAWNLQCHSILSCSTGCPKVPAPTFSGNNIVICPLNNIYF